MILGTSWLKRRNAVIDCSKRTVQLIAPSHEKVEYQAVSTIEHCQVNRDEGAAKGLQVMRESSNSTNRSGQDKNLDSEGMFSRQNIHSSSNLEDEIHFKRGRIVTP
jgi:hypothetical protein